MHQLDAARLFVLAPEKTPAGARLHAIGDKGIPIRDIAGVIGRKLELPVESVPKERFGWLGGFFALDSPAASALTQARFGWKPENAGSPTSSTVRTSRTHRQIHCCSRAEGKPAPAQLGGGKRPPCRT
ncbi:hypothetical protein WMF22_36105 [Sorangium sp. So ce204]